MTTLDEMMKREVRLPTKPHYTREEMMPMCVHEISLEKDCKECERNFLLQHIKYYKMITKSYEDRLEALDAK